MFPIVFDSASSLALFGLLSALAGFSVGSYITYRRSMNLVSRINVTVKHNG